MTDIRILIVEDEGIVAKDIENTLKGLGYSVSATVSSGEEAVRKAAEEQPDLVLMDIVVEGNLDGVEAAKKIHDRLDIPVVYLTAYSDDKTLSRAKKTEPYGYVLKPFEERELHTTIEMALYKHTMEKRLKESEARYRELVENVNSIILRWDTNGQITFCNEFANRFLGYAADEMLGRNLIGTITPEKDSHGQDLRELIRRIEFDPEQYSANENENIRKNGERVWIAWTNKAIRDKQGNIVEILSVGNDITERKRAEDKLRQSEEQLRQSQKMEAIGRLAGGIAHDFNNLLMTITGYSELALNRFDEHDPLKRYIEQIKKAGDRAATLTRQLLAFSRGQLLKPEVLDLNIVVNEIKIMLRRLISEDVNFVLLLEPNLKPVKADAGQMEQVIMNLSVNAADAMPDGGQLTIGTQNVINDEKDPMPVRNAPHGQFVCLSVEDTGTGMDDRTVERIFDPFFTTKGPGEGTGLGLSTVYGIIKQHEGYIKTDTRPGKGTTFRIYLPISPSRSKSKNGTCDTIVSREFQANGERILFVEDEKGVRDFSTTVLRENGYRVFKATTAEDALDIFDRENGEFHLVFSDVVLPGMTGLQLVDEILARKPGLPVLLMSGYTDEKSRWPIIQERKFPFLQKPCGKTVLLRAVKGAIG